MRDLLRKKKYTKKDVAKVKELYRKNFERLKASDESDKRYKTYVKKEKILDALSIKITEMVEKRSLGTVCSLSANLDCFECTGYYVRNIKNKRSKGSTQQYIQVEKDEKDAIHCAIHQSIENFK